MSSIKTILYKQKTLKNGQHPVMLYLNEGRVYRLSLGYSCFKKDWNEKAGKFRNTYPNANVKNLNIRKAELLANEIVDEFVRQGERFNYDIFKKKFRNEEEKNTSNFYDFFQEMIEEKRQLGKIGTMQVYHDALNVLKKFHPKPLEFDKFNYKFLKGLETYLFSRGNNGGSISVRQRTIRAVYYEAVRRDLVEKESNPYSTSTNKNGYSLSHLKSNANPKAMSLEELQLLKSFDLNTYPELTNSWRYFMFSFLTFGINFIDLANLTSENIINGRLNYIRQKTGKSFNILLVDEAKQFISELKNDSKYIFPIFNENIHISEQQKKDRSKKVLKKVNKDLKIIAQILGIETHLTFYSARHTSATTLKRKGISTDVISEALGHRNLDVTQRYLKSFSSEVLDNAIVNL